MREDKIPELKGLYFNPRKTGQWSACVRWLDLLPSMPFDDLYRPNEVLAPWLWIAIMPVPQGAVQVHMWPHLEKWMIEGERASVGWEELRDRIVDLLISEGQP